MRHETLIPLAVIDGMVDSKSMKTRSSSGLQRQRIKKKSTTLDGGQ